MRQVQLRGTDLKASPLGFGCANLMGRVGRRKSLRALQLAWDQGVTYFDTARSYGWGKSESVVGEFAAKRRDRLVLATKLGILPPARNLLLETARPIARAVLSFAARYRLRNATSFVRSQVARRASSQVATGQFDVRAAEQSLDCSLRNLRTDYVDVLLLHGCTVDAVSSGEIFNFLDRSVATGKLRYYGLATDLENSERICQQFPRIQIVQLGNNLLDNALASFSQRDRVATITHTPLGGGKLIDTILNHLRENPDVARRLTALAPCDIATPAGLQRLLLSFALAANPDGVVICGMHTEKNIRANVAFAEQNSTLEPAFKRLAADLRESILSTQITEAAQVQPTDQRGG